MRRMQVLHKPDLTLHLSRGWLVLGAVLASWMFVAGHVDGTAASCSA